MFTPSHHHHHHRGHSQRSSNLSHGLPAVLEPDAHYCWVSPDEKTSVPFSREWEEVHALACEYDLCLTGDALTHIQQLGLEDYFVPLTQVWSTLQDSWSTHMKNLVNIRMAIVTGIAACMHPHRCGIADDVHLSVVDHAMLSQYQDASSRYLPG